VRTIATITITGNAPTTTPPPVTPPATTPPPNGQIISGEASAPPKVGDKVSIELNGAPLQFTVGDNKTLKEVDTAVKTMKVGDKKDVPISMIVSGKVTTAIFVVELMDIQRTIVSGNVLADFIIIVPSQVKVNTTFDVTITAINNSGKTLTGYL
jgi:hypothetical protein